MSTYPRSPKDAVGEMQYFPRMLDKIRLFARGDLAPEYHDNMGITRSADGICLNFLRVKYEDLRKRVLEGGTDEEILEWCYTNGRRLNERDVVVWNSFISKFGLKDFMSGRLVEMKKANGVADRDDIQTITELMDYEEGRVK